MTLTTEQQTLVDETKAKGFKVFSISHEDDFYIYRNINRAEWRDLLKRRNLTGEDNALEVRDQLEEEVVTLALMSPTLTPEQINNLPAGVVSMLSDRIMFASGFGQLEAEAVPL